MIKIGITGSNGFIGWHLCNRLLISNTKYKVVHFERSYFENELFLDNFVNDCDVIIHLAGINRDNNEENIYNVNLSIAKSLAYSCKRTNFKGKLIFSSSIHEEKLESAFGNSKRDARELFNNCSSEIGFNFIGFIIPNVFGPFCLPFYNSVISTFSYQLLNNDTPFLQNDNLLNLIYIDDLVNEFILHIDSNINYNLVRIKHTNSFKVSEILAYLTIFKLDYFEKSIIPVLNNKFELNLFNTFRSFINLDKYYPKNYHNNIDTRGNFVELIRAKTEGQTSYSISAPNITRGNHFHTRKIERFSVIKGKAKIEIRKRGTDRIYTYFLDEKNPSFVDIPIWYSHNITNIGTDELITIFWINEFYNPNDSDTYLENI
jgi:UDP-2-acetamido-2,6-beta-L-arabino-hexul-4-ose reductase